MKSVYPDFLGCMRHIYPLFLPLLFTQNLDDHKLITMYFLNMCYYVTMHFHNITILLIKIFYIILKDIYITYPLIEYLPGESVD